MLLPISRKKTTKKMIPELLTPAGSPEAFIAAVEAGADAVYLGGEFLNARMAANNFGLEEMQQAVDFAHKRLVDVHVTMNTLVGDDELPAAMEYAEKLWKMGVDALIIQDLGLAHLIHNNIPNFPIHMSTQGTIYDLDGVRAAAELGFSRVVLARELSLSEIKVITEGIRQECIKPMEIEIFCHGALCYCYSGQCQMSRAIGGRSANRGACAQPCRMRYLCESAQEAAAQGQTGSTDWSYPLSPKDLDVIDYLPEIAEAGVASIKIEGRMKSPEYVAAVTSIYRKKLDEIASSAEYHVSPEERLQLTQVFGRGFTSLNLLSDSNNLDITEKAKISSSDNKTNPTRDDILSGDSPKNRGLKIGEVINCVTISKNRNDRYYADIKIELDPDLDLNSDLNFVQTLDTAGMPLAMGDIIEVHDSKIAGQSTSMTVTYLKQAKARATGKSNSNSNPNINGNIDNPNVVKGKVVSDNRVSIFRIGDLKEKVFPGDSVYRISSAVQNRELEKYYKGKNLVDGGEGRNSGSSKFIRKIKLIADVTFNNDGAIALSLKEPQTGTIIKSTYKPTDNKFDEQNHKKREGNSNQQLNTVNIANESIHAAMEARIENSLSKTGGTPFAIDSVRFHGDFCGDAETLIPVSEINALRREGLSKMEDALVIRRELPAIQSKNNADATERHSISEKNKDNKNQNNIEERKSTNISGDNNCEAVLELYFYNIEDFNIEDFAWDSDDRNPAKAGGVKGSLADIQVACEKENVKLRIVLPAAGQCLLSERMVNGEVSETKNTFNEVAKNLIAKVESLGAELALYISNVSKGREGAIIESNIDALIDFCAVNNVPLYLGNISQAKFIQDRVADAIKVKGAKPMDGKIKLYADYGINIYNEETVLAIRELGFSNYIDSLESDDIHYGAVPLMTIEHEQPVNEITDHRGRSFQIIKSGYSDQKMLTHKLNPNNFSEIRQAITEMSGNKKIRHYYINVVD